MIERVLAAERRGRILAFLLLTVISLIAAQQLPKLQIDRSDDRLISRENDGWLAFEQMQEKFGREQSVIIYLHADDLWSETRLKQLQTLGYALEDSPAYSFCVLEKRHPT